MTVGCVGYCVTVGCVRYCVTVGCVGYSVTVGCVGYSVTVWCRYFYKGYNALCFLTKLLCLLLGFTN